MFKFLFFIFFSETTGVKKKKKNKKERKKESGSCEASTSGVDILSRLGFFWGENFRAEDSPLETRCVVGAVPSPTLDFTCVAVTKGREKK